MLLCEVALGKTLDKISSDSYLGPKDMKKYGTNSTWGQGQKTPESNTIVDNIRIPNGKLVDSKIKKSVLQYNEYIVYDTSQIKQSYLIVVKKV